MTALVEGMERPAAEATDAQPRKRVLVCIGHYLPGTKDGGPIRSVANMIADLSPHFDFYVVTADRDAGDSASYPGVTPNLWSRVGKARVLYCSHFGPRALRRTVQALAPDIICLTSFQDVLTRTMVVLRWCGMLAKTPTLLAVRGEFSPGAIEIRRAKKAMYRHGAKLLGLYDDVLWQVSTAREKTELLRAAPARRMGPGSIHIVCNISAQGTSKAAPLLKQAGSVKLVFINRISEKKNLHFLLQLLPEIRGAVQLDLYGPIAADDGAYWRRCKALLARLPANIIVTYHGSLEHEAVAPALHAHHFFVLPTRGENFCHAAVEAFVHGTPVVLSDQTPWIDLAQVHAGFDLPLHDREAWVQTLQKCVEMDQRTYATYLEGAWTYGRRFSREEAVAQHVAMFQAALATAEML